MKVVCPKCNSDQISSNQQGFSTGKAVAGAVLVGGIGLLAGNSGSKKVICTCLACGKQFKAGEGKIVYEQGEQPSAQVLQEQKSKEAIYRGSVKFLKVLLIAILCFAVLGVVLYATMDKTPAPKVAAVSQDFYKIVRHADNQTEVWIKDRKDTATIKKLNAYLIETYNPYKKNFMDVNYFDDSIVAKTYEEDIMKVSIKKLDKIDKHIIAQYGFNPNTTYDTFQFK